MKSLALGDVEEFPFLEPPAPRAIADGYQLLQELGAVDDDARADAARPRARAAAARSARRPHDARGARRAAASPRCWSSPARCRCRIRASGRSSKQQAADQAHLQFRDERSDFLSLLALWEFFDERSRRSCRTASASTRAARTSSRILRLLEWRDVHRAARRRDRPKQGWSGRREAARRRSTPRATRRSIGRCSRACSATSASSRRRRRRRTLGARGIRFFLHPGSGLAKKRPKWVLAAELTETTRLFARCAAQIEPEWIEAVAGDRVTRDYFDAALGRRARRGRRERARAALRAIRPVCLCRTLLGSVACAWRPSPKPCRRTIANQPTSGRLRQAKRWASRRGRWCSWVDRRVLVVEKGQIIRANFESSNAISSSRSGKSR